MQLCVLFNGQESVQLFSSLPTFYSAFYVIYNQSNNYPTQCRQDIYRIHVSHPVDKIGQKVIVNQG